MKKELPISLLNTTREVASGMHMPASGQAFSSSNAEDGEALIGGVGDSKTPKDFDIKDLREGTKVEMEHTNDRRIAREIAMDHLTEDPLYYKKLKKIEARVKSILRKNALGLLDVPGGMGDFVDPELDSDESVDDSEVMGFRGIPQNPGLAQESEEYDGETTPFLKGLGDSGEDYNIEELPPINNDIDKRGSENSMLKDLVELKKFLDKRGTINKSKKIDELINKISMDRMYQAYSKSCRWVGNRTLSAYAMDANGELWILDVNENDPGAWLVGEYKLENNLNTYFNQTGDIVYVETLMSGGAMKFNEHFPIIQSLGDAYDLLYYDHADNRDKAQKIIEAKAKFVPKDPEIKTDKFSKFQPDVPSDPSKITNKVIKFESANFKWSNGNPMYGIGNDGMLYTSGDTAGSNYPLGYILDENQYFSASGDYGSEWLTLSTVNIFGTYHKYKDWLLSGPTLQHINGTTKELLGELYDYLYKEQAASPENQSWIENAKLRFLGEAVSANFKFTTPTTAPQVQPPSIPETRLDAFGRPVNNSPSANSTTEQSTPNPGDQTDVFGRTKQN